MKAATKPWRTPKTTYSGSGEFGFHYPEGLGFRVSMYPNSILYTLSLKYHIGSTIRPRYTLVGYMDPWGYMPVWLRAFSNMQSTKQSSIRAMLLQL